MDIAIEIWNILWDYQIPIAFVIVLAISTVVRGGDLLRWLIGKVVGKDKRESNPEHPEK